MEFGVVLQNDPPAWRIVDFARRAEIHGFTHVWTFDSHLLWQEPYVVYSQILANTRRVVVGLPFVTRTAESPRPMPQMVRLPNMSFRVAKSDPVTVGSRVAGLVTKGPTTIRSVAASICE